MILTPVSDNGSPIMILAVVGVFAGVLLSDGWRMVGLALDLGMEVYLIPIYENLFERSDPANSEDGNCFKGLCKRLHTVAYERIRRSKSKCEGSYIRTLTQSLRSPRFKLAITANVK